MDWVIAMKKEITLNRKYVVPEKFMYIQQEAEKLKIQLDQLKKISMSQIHRKDTDTEKTEVCTKKSKT
jgi:hypothetical protein